MKMKGILLLAMSAACLTGCGTVGNFASEHPQPYGGVILDMNSAGSGHYSAGGGGGLLVPALIIGAGATEFCATVVGDTLTAPYILWCEVRLSCENAANEAAFSKLPTQDSTDSVVTPAAPMVAGCLVPAEEKGREGK
jgi:hypothetical protein